MNSPQGKSDTGQSSEFQDNLEILRHTFFFAGVPMEGLKVFAYICQREAFKDGEYLFRQDEDDGQAFYILSGKADLTYRDEKGEETIRTFEGGDFLGGTALLGENRRLFSLKASEEVTCLILSREKFRTTIQQFPDLMPKIVRSVVDQISSWEAKFIESRDKGCETCRHKLGVSVL